MAIRVYEKDGKKQYQVYVNARSKIDQKIRVQRTVSDLESLSLARREENRIHQELGKRLLELEGKCVTWQEVIDKWEHEARRGYLGEYNLTTIIDHVSCLNKWTKDWRKKIAGAN